MSLLTVNILLLPVHEHYHCLLLKYQEMKEVKHNMENVLIKNSTQDHFHSHTVFTYTHAGTHQEILLHTILFHHLIALLSLTAFVMGNWLS